MPVIALNIPDSVLVSRAVSVEEIKKESRFVLASHLFQKGWLSSGMAAEMCEMNRVDFLLMLGRSGIPIADLDGEELDREISNA